MGKKRTFEIFVDFSVCELFSACIRAMIFFIARNGCDGVGMFCPDLLWYCQIHAYDVSLKEKIKKAKEKNHMHINLLTLSVLPEFPMYPLGQRFGSNGIKDIDTIE